MTEKPLNGPEPRSSRATSHERLARVCRVLGMRVSDISRSVGDDDLLSAELWQLIDRIEDVDMRRQFAELFRILQTRS